MAKVGTVTVFFGGNARQLNAVLKGVGARMSALGKKATALGGSLTTKLTLPLALIGGVAVKSFADFDFQMRRVAAVSSATGEQFKKMTDLARKMGRTTQFTARQSAEAMTFLSVAGFKTTETMGALPGVLQLAAAGAVDLGSAADIASKILKGYNFDVKELSRVNDVLTKTFISSNTMLGDLGEGFRVLAPIARTAGLRFEEMSAALGLLGDNAFQGGTAGTGLRRIISGLLKPSKEGTKIFKAMGLQVIAASGKMRKMSDILRDLKVGLDSMGGQAEQAGLLMELFGLRGGPVMAALLKEGGDRLDEFTEKLDKAGGTAERIATQQMAGLKGALLELTSALQDAGLALGKTLEPVVRSVGGTVKNLAISFSESSQIFKNVAVGTGVFAAALGPLLLGFGALAASGRVVFTVLKNLSPFLKVGGLLVVGTLAWGSAIHSLRKDFDTVFDGLPSMFDIPKKALKSLVTEIDEARAGLLEMLGGGGQRAAQAKQEKLFKRQNELIQVFAERVELLGKPKGLTRFGLPQQILALGKNIPALMPMLRELVTINQELGTTSEKLAKKFQEQSEALGTVAGGFVRIKAETAEDSLVLSFTQANMAAKGVAGNLDVIREGVKMLVTDSSELPGNFEAIATDTGTLFTNLNQTDESMSRLAEGGGFVVEKLIDVSELLEDHKKKLEENNTVMMTSREVTARLATGTGTWRDRLEGVAEKVVGINTQLLAAEATMKRINNAGGAKVVK